MRTATSVTHSTVKLLTMALLMATSVGKILAGSSERRRFKGECLFACIMEYRFSMVWLWLEMMSAITTYSQSFPCSSSSTSAWQHVYAYPHEVCAHTHL